MDFSEALAKATVESSPVRNCAMSRILENMTEQSRKQTLDALADRDVKTVLIERSLELMGHKISAHSVTRHRRGLCACV